MKFITLKNKVIDKHSIVYIAFDWANLEINITMNNLDTFVLCYSDKKSMEEEMDFLEGECCYTYECDLYNITQDEWINLYEVSCIEFVKDTINKEERYIAQVYWKTIKMLPKTYVMPVDTTEEEIEIMQTQIGER